jgi:hypothetical protein
MKIRNSLFAVLVFLFLMNLGTVYSNPTDTIQGNITATVNLDNTKKYLLFGPVFIKAGGVLNIPAGTVIFGDKESKGTLIVERGGQVFAQGTANNPIIFTSELPAGQRTAGDWGGIVILGRARINTPDGRDTSTIEGIDPPVYFGGQNDDDNSGVLRYVRIEFAGIEFTPNNQINSLTMGGVGRNTVIEYIQVSYGGDDAFEWFGGTVNAKYLVSYITLDDDFDVDNGFRGNLQYGISLRNNPNIADVSGSHGIESDNNSQGNFNGPRTKPIFSNFTFIGPKVDTNTAVNPFFTRGYHLRRSSLTSTYNSIIMGWPDAVLYDGAGVTNACLGDTMQHRNNIYAGNPGGFKTNQGSFDPTAWTQTTAFQNRFLATTQQVMLTSPYGSPTALDFRPAAGSPALTGSNFAYPNLSSFENTAYVGAFGADNWMAGWASFTPETNDYKTIGITNYNSNVPDKFILSQNYPNPFNPSTKINFALPETGFVSLKVFDATGRQITELVNQNLIAGEYEYEFNASSLTTGVYFYTLRSDNFSETRKMLLVK